MKNYQVTDMVHVGITNINGLHDLAQSLKITEFRSESQILDLINLNGICEQLIDDGRAVSIQQAAKMHLIGYLREDYGIVFPYPCPFNADQRLESIRVALGWSSKEINRLIKTAIKHQTEFSSEFQNTKTSSNQAA